MFDKIVRYTLTNIADKNCSSRLTRYRLYYTGVVIVVVIVVRLKESSVGNSLLSSFKMENFPLLIATRIAPALLGLRQALKISIYDYLSKFHQINAELFLNCYDAIIFIAVSQ